MQLRKTARAAGLALAALSPAAEATAQTAVAPAWTPEISAYRMGKPSPRRTERDPRAVLGPPDFKSPGDGKALTLGCGGSLDLAFPHGFVDREGPDIQVVEVGPADERIDVAVSSDGRTFETLGVASQTRRAFDLAAASDAARTFYFIRLTDLRDRCDGPWPGADLDAVRVRHAIPAPR